MPVARELEALQERLQRIVDSLPVSEREDAMYAGEEDYDFGTEARAVLQCVRTDGIAPAIRDLRGAAAYGRKRKKRA